MPCTGIITEIFGEWVWELVMEASKTKMITPYDRFTLLIFGGTMTIGPVSEAIQGRGDGGVLQSTNGGFYG